MKRYEKLIEIARALKPLRQELRSFHVAAVFKKNQLISLGWNTKRTHPRTKQFYPAYKSDNATHSEALAIIRAKLENFVGYDLIVVRINNNGQIDYSRPCEYCAKFLRWVNFDNIYYSDAAGNLQQFTY